MISSQSGAIHLWCCSSLSLKISAYVVHDCLGWGWGAALEQSRQSLLCNPFFNSMCALPFSLYIQAENQSPDIQCSAACMQYNAVLHGFAQLVDNSALYIAFPKTKQNALNDVSSQTGMTARGTNCTCHSSARHTLDIRHWHSVQPVVPCWLGLCRNWASPNMCLLFSTSQTLLTPANSSTSATPHMPELAALVLGSFQSLGLGLWVSPVGSEGQRFQATPWWIVSKPSIACFVCSHSQLHSTEFWSCMAVCGLETVQVQ